MKMYCKIKRPDNAKYTIEKGEKIVIQEKIDGSNTAIYNDNGKMCFKFALCLSKYLCLK